MPISVNTDVIPAQTSTLGGLYSKSFDDLEKAILGGTAAASSFRKKAAQDIGKCTEACTVIHLDSITLDLVKLHYGKVTNSVF